MSEPILALPMDTGTYTLDCDASNYGLAAVLSQEQSGIEKVIAYSSRTMSKPELRYDATRKELLAIVNGLKQFRQYLTGRHFMIRTDHDALSWLRRTPEPMPQLARWLTFIEEFDFEVVHRDGRKHSNADGLSRRAGPLPASYKRAIESDSESTSSEQMDMVFHDAITEQDEAISCEHFELREQIPSARPVLELDKEQAEIREPDKEQAETELEPSVTESLAARQQPDPEIGTLVRMRTSKRVQLPRCKGAKTMTVHIDKVKPFLGEVPKSWVADEPSSDVRELPERADDETLVKAPNTEPVSEQVSAKSAYNELINEPELEEESALSTNIDYEVDNTRPAERPRRAVQAPKYLDEYVRLVPANGQGSY